MINAPQFADTSKASLDSVLASSGKALAGLEQFVALNLQVIKSSLAESADLTRATLAAKDLTEVVKLQTAVLQTVPQKTMAYMRQVMDIVTSATAEQRAAAEAQMAEAQAKFMDAVKGALKDAPGAESALAMMKATVSASNNAYDGAKKASRQVTDAVDANITKITESTSKVIAG